MENTTPSSIIQQSLDTIRQRLLDISKRNPLLNYQEKARTIHIADTKPEKIFKKLVPEGKTMIVVPQAIQAMLGKTNPQTPESREQVKKWKEVTLQTAHDEEVLERRCKKLAQEARSAIEETGHNLLYLVIGFLQWYEQQDTTMRQAPLVLIPVKLERIQLPATSTFQYGLSYRDEDIETNISLAEKLANDFNLVLPVLADDIQPNHYLAQVAEVVQNIPDWQVVSDIRLDFFSFTKLLMYKDLENANWPENAKLIDNANLKQLLVGNEKVAELLNGQNLEAFNHDFLDTSSLAEQTPLILDADSSQQAVIMEALWKPTNLVIEGPPGTGKSQTITNLIATALSQNKSVLFVAEKKAALEVVKSRLDKAGLGEFCLELHSHKTQKAELHNELRKRLETEYWDCTSLENEIAELTQQKHQLVAYSNLINTKVGPNQERIYEVFWIVEWLRGEIVGEPLLFEVPNPFQIKREELNEKIDKLQDLGEQYAILSQDVIQHWQGFQPTQIWPGDDKKIQKVLSNLFLATQAHQAYLEVLLEETQIPLMQDLATLHALTQINVAVLTPISTPFPQAVIIKLLDQRVIEKVRQFQTQQKEYRQLLNQATKFLGYGKYVVKFLQQIANVAGKLDKLGFSNDSPAELQQLVQSVDKLEQELQSLLNNPESVNQFLKFLKLRELAEQAPPNLVLNKHPEHALEATPIIFQQARQSFAQLAEQWAERKNDFLFSKLPNSEQIAILADELRKHQNSWLPIFSADYWRTKSAIKRFLATSRWNHRQLVKQLETLAALKRKTEQESQRAQYQRLFGSLFMGLETDWVLLEQCIEWAQNLGEAFGSLDKAQELLATQTDPQGYLLKTTAILYEQWLRVTKVANQFNVSLNSHLLVNEFVEQLLERRNKVEQLVSFLQQQLPHLSDKHIISIHSAVQNLLMAWKIRHELEQNQVVKKFVGKEYQGIETDVTALVTLADWITQLQTVGNLPQPLLHWLVSPLPQPSESQVVDKSKPKKVSTPATSQATKKTEKREASLVVKVTILQELISKNQTYLTQFSEQCRQLAAFGDLNIQQWFRCADIPNKGGFHACTLAQIATTVHTCQTSVGSLGTLANFYQLKQELEEMDLSVITHAITERQIFPQQAHWHFQYAFYQSMARELIRQHTLFAKFTRSHYENLRQRFAELDKKLLTSHSQRIAAQIAKQHIPEGDCVGKVSTFTEKCLIQHELNKKRRHIPIRQLVRRSTKALQALKPCFMMSPLSVAQYLPPGKVQFDLLIMDEASQIRPEDALGAIARSQQVVIVGDPKQLPPRQFFERLVNEEEDTTLLEGQESILDIGLSCYPNRRLRWHYRSEHESLIAFSNHHFYDDELVVFPAPETKPQEGGVHLNYVEKATYYKGRNQKEAETVVAAIVIHFRHTPHLSLGVATFNLKQQELIQDILDKRCQQDTWLAEQLKATETRQEPFFIKNLENVQGDERDVIFVSTTYGADPDTGNVFQRFGPISGETGWRRLNVIFTRAKKRLELFTSLRSTDIALKTGSKRGVQILKAYLEYAETGHLPDTPVNLIGKQSDSHFEIAIATLLQKHGYRTVSQVGVAGFRIDIGVCYPEEPNQYILGIECDGANYHLAKSLRDRDRLRQEILVSKGWKLHQIWAVDWYKNREVEMERLLRALAEINQASQKSVQFIPEINE